MPFNSPTIQFYSIQDTSRCTGLRTIIDPINRVLIYHSRLIGFTHGSRDTSPLAHNITHSQPQGKANDVGDPIIDIAVSPSDKELVDFIARCINRSNQKNDNQIGDLPRRKSPSRGRPPQEPAKNAKLQRMDKLITECERRQFSWDLWNRRYQKNQAGVQQRRQMILYKSHTWSNFILSHHRVNHKVNWALPGVVPANVNTDILTYVGVAA